MVTTMTMMVTVTAMITCYVLDCTSADFFEKEVTDCGSSPRTSCTKLAFQPTLTPFMGLGSPRIGVARLATGCTHIASMLNGLRS